MTDAGIATIVTGVITVATMIVGFLTLWLKLKYGVSKVEEAAVNAKVVEKKIDDNTTITKAASVAAVSNAKRAADTAIEAKEATAYMAEQLNGKLEEKINAIVKAQTEPILAVIKTHIDQDDRNMAEIRDILGHLRDRSR